MNKFFIHALVASVLLFSAPAMAENSETDPSEPISDPVITLEGEMKDGYTILEWKTEHESPHGFKMVRSTETSEPTYPNDHPVYYDKNSRQHKDWDVKAGKAYHYRVCAYTGDGCEFYSNTVSLAPEEDVRICTLDYSPVCGVDGVTYGNKCQAGDVPIEYEGECENEEAERGENVIHLGGEIKDGYVFLEWKSDYETRHGVKVLRSEVNQKPLYPAENGDIATYLNGAQSYRDFNVKGGQTYHYRICEYNSQGECGIYSETMTLTLPDDFLSVKDRKYDIHKENGEKMEQAYKDEDLQDEWAELKAELKRLKSELKAVREELNDIKRHRYKAAIEYLADENVVRGYDDGTFKPDNTVNRAEFLKMVIAAQFGEELSQEDHSCFEDVEGQWFAPYVCLAKKKGIVSGYDDGTFKPGQEINFVEAAKIVNQVYGLKGKAQKTGDEWYKDYVKKLQDKKFIPPTVKKLEKKLSRGEMAEMLWRIKENKQNEETEKLIQD